jgi:hypothetical protein
MPKKEARARPLFYCSQDNKALSHPKFFFELGIGRKMLSISIDPNIIDG